MPRSHSASDDEFKDDPDDDFDDDIWDDDSSDDDEFNQAPAGETKVMAKSGNPKLITAVCFCFLVPPVTLLALFFGWKHLYVPQSEEWQKGTELLQMRLSEAETLNRNLTQQLDNQESVLEQCLRVLGSESDGEGLLSQYRADVEMFGNGLSQDQPSYRDLLRNQEKLNRMQIERIQLIADETDETTKQIADALRTDVTRTKSDMTSALTRRAREWDEYKSRLTERFGRLSTDISEKNKEMLTAQQAEFEQRLTALHEQYWMVLLPLARRAGIELDGAKTADVDHVQMTAHSGTLIADLTPDELRIHQALQTPLRVELAATTLKDTVAFFRDHFQIRILLDEHELEDERIDPQTDITFSDPFIRFESALEHILRPLELDWIVRDDAIVITTHASVKDHQDVVTFDVSTLLARRDEPFIDEDDLRYSYGVLVDLIKSSVEPDSWSETSEASIRAFDGILVVTHHRRALTAVGKLLRDLELRRNSSRQTDNSSGELVTKTYVVASPLNTTGTATFHGTRGFGGENPSFPSGQGPEASSDRMTSEKALQELTSRLAAIVPTVVEPTSWTNGSPAVSTSDKPSIEAIGGTLVIRQYARNHARIRRALLPFLYSPTTVPLSGWIPQSDPRQYPNSGYGGGLGGGGQGFF